MRFAILGLALYSAGVLVPQTGSVAQVFRIEAESGALDGFGTLYATFFSGEYATNAQVASPAATYTFPGWNGPYDISIGYCDEDDGTSSYTLSGSSAGTVASWQGDQPTGETNCNPTSLLTREIATFVTLEQGETITLECQRDGQEPCRVDYFDFTYVGPMPPVGERAFPGALGFGALTSGARGLGAEVCVVTNLIDSGPGSFRACAEQASPAYITFAVSGYIDLDEEVRITGHKTIECATAPGDGVVFRQASLDIADDNVILRGCRAWVGGEPGGEPFSYRDGIFVQRNGAEVRHAIVANSSMMFATDENAGTWYDVYNVTFQHNLVAWGTRWADEDGNKHGGYGMLIGDDVATVSAIENYLAFNRHRNPLVGPDPAIAHMSTPVEFVSNLVYCYGPQAARIRASSSVHVVGNLFRPCPSQYSTPDEISLRENTVAYVADNVMSDGSPATVEVDATSEASAEPLFASTVTPVSSTQVAMCVFAKAGPARLTAFEIEVFEHYANGTGTLIDWDAFEGWPTLEGGTSPPDGDGDGMPDWWETDHCGGPCAPTADQDGDGYENIEEWFHSFYKPRTPVRLKCTEPVVS